MKTDVTQNDENLYKATVSLKTSSLQLFFWTEYHSVALKKARKRDYFSVSKLSSGLQYQKTTATSLMSH